MLIRCLHNTIITSRESIPCAIKITAAAQNVTLTPGSVIYGNDADKLIVYSRRPELKLTEAESNLSSLKLAG